MNEKLKIIQDKILELKIKQTRLQNEKEENQLKDFIKNVEKDNSDIETQIYVLEAEKELILEKEKENIKTKAFINKTHLIVGGIFAFFIFFGIFYLLFREPSASQPVQITLPVTGRKSYNSLK